MSDVDFSGVIGGSKKPKKDKKVEKTPKMPEPDTKPLVKKAVEQAPQPKPQPVPEPQVAQANQAGDKTALETRIEALEAELKAFHAQPQEVREKQGENFEFKQITNQIKEKVKSARAGAGFNESVVAQAARETQPQKETKPQEVSSLKKMERIPSGIKGLDPLIEGGFEQGSTVLVVGSAGVGKTLFGLQFLYHGAVDYKEAGIFITFEEEREALFKHSSSFGWDFEKLEKEGMFRVLQYKPHQVEKLMQDGGGPIRDAIKEMGAKRLVIDSITSYGMLFKDEYTKRESVLDLFDYLHKWGCTALIISELPPKVAEVKEGSVGFLTDAIISLYYSKQHESGERVHSMEILKMRGTKHTDKLLAIQFEKDGINIYSDVEVF